MGYFLNFYFEQITVWERQPRKYLKLFLGFDVIRSDLMENISLKRTKKFNTA